MPALIDRTPALIPRPSNRESIANNSLLKMESVSHALKQRDGKLLVCDVSLYFQLYQELLQKSQGNTSLAKKYVFEAAKKDGTALIQENISALSVNGTPLFDLESRARMQLTPTVNTYLHYQEERFNEETGQKEITQKMVSPEHAYIGRSVTEALTGWRRGNDAVVMAQNEELFVNFEKKFDPTKTHTLIWGSPIAEKAEGQLINKYNGEYGYLYVGKITHEAGVRKMLVHSYKTDMKTDSYQAMMRELGGQEFFAGFGKENSPETEQIDRVMRTSLMMEGELTPEQVYDKMFKTKQNVKSLSSVIPAEAGIHLNSPTIFGIDQQTLMAVQDPELRQALEERASSEVAVWLAGEIVKGTDAKTVQGLIKDKYISVVKKVIRQVQTERMLANSATVDRLGNPIVDETRVDMTALKEMKTNTGAFCGTWESSGGGASLSGSLKNFTTFSGGGWGGNGSESGSSEKVFCSDCKKKQVAGSCGLCSVCFPE